MNHTSQYIYQNNSYNNDNNNNDNIVQNLIHIASRRRRRRKYPQINSSTSLDKILLFNEGRRMRSVSDIPRSYKSKAKMIVPQSSLRLLLLVSTLAISTCGSSISTTGQPDTGLKFDPDTSAYSGLTFSFDPRLDKQQVERLHFDHWHSIMHQASSLLYESLNGRAHLSEVRVLIPYKWRHFEWPILHKPGSPIIVNRRLRFADSDVIISQEDPIRKETPFALQHDECGRPGLNIHMPISFLDEPQVDERLRARQFVREFASHRWGLFKESGFRSDYMYPPFSALPGIAMTSSKWRWANLTDYQNQSSTSTVLVEQLDEQRNSADLASQVNQLRGYDDQWRECKFETSPNSGLPTVNAQNCLPYLESRPVLESAATSSGASLQLQEQQPPMHSFNLMSADPFSYTSTIPGSTGASGNGASGSTGASQLAQQLPATLAHWRQLAGSVHWHFCGENFALANSQNLLTTNGQQAQQHQTQLEQHKQANWFEHNQRTANKQNKLCHERSAFDVIKSSDDFRRVPSSLPTFNRIPEPQFKFLQEMPPRVILAFEYTSHLYSSRRLDHSVLESAINKFLAFDLIQDSEVASLVFSQHTSRLLKPFQRLDEKLDSRFALFNPAFDPFDEQAQVYTQQELLDEISTFASGSVMHQNSAQSSQQQPRILKGTCSFARLMNEVNSLLQKQRERYADVGADLIVITSGLFVEDSAKIEEIIRHSQFHTDQHKLNLIVYPATMLFDTRSRDNLSILDSIESELIVRSRIEKLLLIQRLMSGQIHLVKEHLDSNGEVKISSTLVQFYQIFEHIARGHSWDQTNSMLMLEHRPVVSSPMNNLIANGSKLTYQFEFDSTISNELLVGFVDPRPSSSSINSISHRPGKRFALKDLQLRSPGGQLVFTEAQTSSSILLLQNQTESITNENHQQPSNELQSDLILGESAIFPHRAQLSFAGFHIRHMHLTSAAVASPSKLVSSRFHTSGVWTLSAISEEPLQTSALLMAKTNPTGDTLTATCWIQTYSKHLEQQDTSEGSNKSKQQLNAIKVFARINSGQTLDTSSIGTRLEVHDEMGNIVQNSRLLDDGLGSPDITRNDNIYSQYVHRSQRSGFYRVMVEVGNLENQNQPSNKIPMLHSQAGQDNVCCGSFVPKSADQVQQPILGQLRRQIYCGTFYVDPDNKLGEQRPPRISNLTVVNVDQDQRQVKLRWFEPQVLESIGVSNSPSVASRQQSPWTSNLPTSNVKFVDEPITNEAVSILNRAKRASVLSDSKKGRGFDEVKSQTPAEGGRGVIIDSNKNQVEVAPLSSRYEIKLFTDRDIMKRAFDSKHEVGYTFNEWNVEGIVPNASIFGGQKEINLRIPFGREGVYFIAMRVLNNLNIGSEMSNIVQFYLRNNLTIEELESVYGQSSTIDADGNVYDKNGDLIHRSGQPGAGPYSSLLKGASGLDGLSILILFSLLAFFMSIVCISLVACLASSARRSLSKQKDGQLSTGQSSKRRNNEGGSSGSMLAGSGSSMVSAGSSPAASSSPSQCGSSDGDALQQKQIMDLQQQQQQHQMHQYGNYGNRCIQQAHEHQQAQAQMIHNQLLSNQNQYQQQQQHPQSWPHHTVVNGYTYATVGPAATTVDSSTGILNTDQYGNHYGTATLPSGQHVQPLGDLNQNGLGLEDDQRSTMSPVQSWPADVLLSHYDKVKMARQRSEQHTMMSLENSKLDESGQDQVTKSVEQSYAMRQQQQQLSTYMINQQLQQQLSSVLKSKRQSLIANDLQVSDSSSPALEGIRGEQEVDQHQQHYSNSSNLNHQVVAPPPPQYIYSTLHTVGDHDHMGAALVNGLSTHHVDPSIYSQTTNLQQVISPTTDGSGYYANQWPSSDQAIYGSTSNPNQYLDNTDPSQNFVNQVDSTAISEV